jgi:nucleoside-diphosphate-sugar epimerase
MQSSVLVVGCGYIGLPVARRLYADGFRVLGVKASYSATVTTEKFPVCVANIGDAGSLETIRSRGPFDLVIHCASSGRGGPEQYRQVFYSGMLNLLKLGAHVMMCSSTSVYAQREGEWVDENSEATPSRETGKILRESEELLLSYQGTVARLAGIYGPDRHVLLSKLLRGEATIEEYGDRVLNMIHRDDAVAALVFLAKRGVPGIFNVVDDEPVTQRAWYEWTCNQLGLPFPPSVPKDLNRKRGWTSKRVSNAKLKSLGWTLQHPVARLKAQGPRLN